MVGISPTMTLAGEGGSVADDESAARKSRRIENRRTPELGSGVPISQRVVGGLLVREAALPPAFAHRTCDVFLRRLFR